MTRLRALILGGLLWTGFLAANPAEAGCCVTPGYTCLNDYDQFQCETIYSPSAMPSGRWVDQACTDVALCETGKCENRSDTGDCVNVTRVQCTEQYSATHNFTPNQQCAVSSTGTCCIETSPSPGQTPTCSATLTQSECQQRLWSFQSRSCSEISTCTNTGTSTGGSAPEPQPVLIFDPEIPLPDFAGGAVTNTTFYEYLVAVFRYFMILVGVLATVMVVYGGIKWVAAAGNPGRINDARDTINSAIIGIIIALTSVVLLNLISPQFTQFRGLTISQVEPKLLNIQRAISSAVTIARCSAPEVRGGIDTACYNESNPSCSSGLNGWINSAARQFGADPVLVKAIIMQESPKTSAGFPLSGPTNIREAGNSQRRASSAYGIGQMVCDTLESALRGATSSVPSECQNCRQRADQSTNLAPAQCRDWLDRRLETQVKAIAYYVATIGQQPCVNGDLTLTAFGYKRGEGAASAYCKGENLKGKSDADMQAIISDGVNYANGVNQIYQTLCGQSGT